MRRFLMVGILAVWATPLRADDAQGVKQTIAYVQKLQTSTGGFTATAPQPNVRLAPNLQATSAGVRGLHYWGGEVPDKAGAIKFVESCWDEASGGFANFPKGKPDVFTTAVGMMAVSELKMPTSKYWLPATNYLAENAKGFDDIRIAAAGCEALQKKLQSDLPQIGIWVEGWDTEVMKGRNADGTFGKGAGKARDTASRIVTLMRIGLTVKNRDAVLKVLTEGQRRNGGYGKEDDENASDLETTYRVMRCFVMLKARPDNVEGVRSFVAKCRNEDGGYGTAPGQPSNINGTYFAAILRHWLDKKE